MTVEQALKTAIEFETRVQEVYAEACAGETDEAARRTLEVLAKEEGYHLEYLRERLDEWVRKGQISFVEITSLIPSAEKITQAVNYLREKLAGKTREPHRRHIEILQRAQKVEEETSNFYRRLVSEIEGPSKAMFSRFLEIEDGHLALVSAELDAVQGLGFWFDIREFDLEAG